MYVSHLCSVPHPTFTYMAPMSCYHTRIISISYTTTFTTFSRCRSYRGEKTVDGLELLLGGRQCMHVHHMPIIPTKSHYRSLSCVLCVTRYSVDQLRHMHSCSSTHANARDGDDTSVCCMSPSHFSTVHSPFPRLTIRHSRCSFLYSVHGGSNTWM